MRPMRFHHYAPRPAILKWLFDSDPSIRWQVMKGLSDKAPDAIGAERSRIAIEGGGAKLLALQAPAGNWGRSKEDRGLLVTLYTHVLLMDLGLDPASKQARKMVDRVGKRLVFQPLNSRPFLHGEMESCINGRILALGAHFKEPNNELARQLLGEQLEDGGRNREAVEPSAKRRLSRRSSFHTTICVLEGLLAYERAGRKSAAVTYRTGCSSSTACPEPFCSNLDGFMRRLAACAPSDDAFPLPEVLRANTPHLKNRSEYI
jgi:hypothetical protein